jgi:hypothetical protein
MRIILVDGSAHWVTLRDVRTGKVSQPASPPLYGAETM